MYQEINNSFNFGSNIMLILGRILIIALLVLAILACIALCIWLVKKINKMVAKNG
jgi:flagellar basal body-associated protein FliL